MADRMTPKRKGDLAELHVASLLLADPQLEVFATASDDGLGSDLAVRSARTGRWYSIQVKAATLRSNPCVYMNRFRAEKDFLVAAVVLDDASRPREVFLCPGPRGTEASGCLSRNDGGGAGGPYMEIRTTALKHAGELAKYAFDRVAPRL